MPKKNNSTKNSEGFIATTAIILLAMGSLAFLVATMSASVSYADSIERGESRMQKALNQKACEETRQIMKAKDHFWSEEIVLSDLECSIRP